MRFRKGQEDLIFVVIIFWMAVTLAFVMFILTSGNQNKVEQEVDREIKYQIGDIRKRSTITTTMNDYMWRAPEVENDYDGRTAYKLISYYFSTPGESVYVDGESIPMSEVRQDLKAYLNYKMDRYWDTGSNKVDYYLNISQQNPGTRPRNITVKKNEYYPEARWSSISYPISLADGRSARVILWTKTSKGIYGVSGE